MLEYAWMTKKLNLHEILNWLYLTLVTQNRHYWAAVEPVIPSSPRQNSHRQTEQFLEPSRQFLVRLPRRPSLRRVGKQRTRAHRAWWKNHRSLSRTAIQRHSSPLKDSSRLPLWWCMDWTTPRPTRINCSIWFAYTVSLSFPLDRSYVGKVDSWKLRHHCRQCSTNKVFEDQRRHSNGADGGTSCCGALCATFE